jgi:hypothetical protein
MKDESMIHEAPAKLADKYGLNQCPRCGGRHGGTEWARMHLEARRTRT